MKKNILNTLIAGFLFTTGVFAQKGDMHTAIEISAPSCAGSSDASLKVNPSGGMAPYHYVWSTGDTTDMITGLSAGIYSVTIFDHLQSSILVEMTVVDPAPIAISGIVTGSSTPTSYDGQIDVNVTGIQGTMGFHWTSDDGGGIDNTTLDQNALLFGTYNLVVFDDHGCSATGTFTIVKPSELVLPGLQNPSVNPESVNRTFPNPTNGTVNFRTGIDTEKMEIYDQFGNLMTVEHIEYGTAKTQTMDLGKGTYIAIFYAKDGSTDKQIFTVR